MPAPLKSNADKLQELRDLDAAIAERKRYFKEQEILIADLIESGNTQLLYLHHDIIMAKQELRGIKTDIRTFSHDKVLLNRHIEHLQLQVGGVIIL